jgi:hypothetical protein
MSFLVVATVMEWAFGYKTSMKANISEHLATVMDAAYFLVAQRNNTRMITVNITA